MTRKRFGQHFLHEKMYLQKIIEVVDINRKDNFIEIGPGGGALTKYLIDSAKFVHAIEIDEQLYCALQQKFSKKSNLQLYHADALQFDMTSLLGQSLEKMRMIGNLAYNIATPLLFQMIKYRTYIKDLHFMLQKEMANRLVARKGNKDYSRFSVMMQYFFETKQLFNVSNGAFTPAPKVESAMVSLTPKYNTVLNEKQEENFSAIVKQAFQQKRKIISNTLKIFGFSSEQFMRLNIDPKKRPAELSIEDYIKIVQHMA